MIQDIKQLIRSGGVKRWHQYPEMNGCNENLAEHQWTVAMLVLFFDPGVNRDTIVATLTHDVGELETGDISYRTGRTNEQANAEADALEKIIGPITVSTRRELDILVLADRLAAWIKMMQFNPALRRETAWAEMRTEMYVEAERLGLSDKFSEVMNAFR